MSLFKKNKNRNKVENPYYSLGLLQQTMIISSADHQNRIILSLIFINWSTKKWTSAACVCGGGEGGGGRGAGTPVAPPFPTGLLFITVFHYISENGVSLVSRRRHTRKTAIRVFLPMLYTELQETRSMGAKAIKLFISVLCLCYCCFISDWFVFPFPRTVNIPKF